MKSQDEIKLLHEEIKLLHKEIKKRDKIIDDLKEKNIVLLKTSIKKGEDIKELQDMINRVKKTKK